MDAVWPGWGPDAPVDPIFNEHRGVSRHFPTANQPGSQESTLPCSFKVAQTSSLFRDTEPAPKQQHVARHISQTANRTTCFRTFCFRRFNFPAIRLADEAMRPQADESEGSPSHESVRMCPLPINIVSGPGRKLSRLLSDLWTPEKVSFCEAGVPPLMKTALILFFFCLRGGGWEVGEKGWVVGGWDGGHLKRTHPQGHGGGPGATQRGHSHQAAHF